MRRMIFRRLFALVVVTCVLAFVCAACKKPVPPKLTPKEVRVTAVSTRGIDVLMTVEATNPNSITLSARSVTGKAKLDGRYDMATVTIDKPVVLPPNVPTMIEAPMTLPWTDLGALQVLAQSAKPVPYTVEGTVAVGGENLNVDVPFTVSGTITREQIAAAALKSLPAIPGLVPPPK